MPGCDAAAGAGVTAGVTAGVPLPAAVARPVTDLVAGPLLPATVLAVHSAAVILTVESAEGTRVLTVLAAEGTGVPNGVRTALPAAGRPFARLSPGDAAFVGAGGVRLPGMRLQAVRIVETAVPVVRVPPAAVTIIAAAAGAASRGVGDEPVQALRAALAQGCPADLRRAVHGLVGLGAGSTPGGDDVLCGTLAGLHATDRAVLVQQVRVAALDGLAERTSLVSADLLRLAAAGHACAEAAAVLRAAGRGDRIGLGRALTRLLAVGHSSGADLATGLAIGLGAPFRPVLRQPRMADRATTGRTTMRSTPNHD